MVLQPSSLLCYCCSCSCCYCSCPQATAVALALSISLSLSLSLSVTDLDAHVAPVASIPYISVSTTVIHAYVLQAIFF